MWIRINRRLLSMSIQYHQNVWHNISNGGWLSHIYYFPFNTSISHKNIKFFTDYASREYFVSAIIIVTEVENLSQICLLNGLQNDFDFISPLCIGGKMHCHCTIFFCFWIFHIKGKICSLYCDTCESTKISNEKKIFLQKKILPLLVSFLLPVSILLWKCFLWKETFLNVWKEEKNWIND